jgi:aspartyl-tRNA synthetase
VHPGKFFACRKPQLFKQLLKLADTTAISRLRAASRDGTSARIDQPDFTQIDIEMSFVKKLTCRTVNEGFLSVSQGHAECDIELRCRA